MAKNNIWNDQFKDANVPMPETGAFAWRRQQMTFNQTPNVNISLAERGPNLLERALTGLRNKLSELRTRNNSLNHSQASQSGAIAK